MSVLPGVNRRWYGKLADIRSETPASQYVKFMITVQEEDDGGYRYVLPEKPSTHSTIKLMS